MDGSGHTDCRYGDSVAARLLMGLLSSQKASDVVTLAVDALFHNPLDLDAAQ
jgi:hypothetical protein